MLKFTSAILFKRLTHKVNVLSKKIVFDLIIAGGGIHGCSIANQAAQNHLSVALFEAKDFASATSSASSKLLHGGLRYLEQFQFRLVTEALAEREAILHIAPHITDPLTFCLPLKHNTRPRWMIRIGLFLYDFLSKKTKLPTSKSITFHEDSPLYPDIQQGFQYSDCWVDDARLVIENAKAAKRQGATLCNYTQIIRAKRHDNLWHVTVQDQFTQETRDYYSKALLNTTGPWVADFLKLIPEKINMPAIQLIKGSHIILPKLHDEKQAYLLQSKDQRIIFVLPYQEHYSLIGTTDQALTEVLETPTIHEHEIQYLISIVNQYFKKNIQPDDIIDSFSGIRALLANQTKAAQDISRDYTLLLDDQAGETPLLSLLGGKLTTYRKLSELALNKLKPYFDHLSVIQKLDNPLPGGNIESKSDYYQTLLNQYSWLKPAIAFRLARTYGSDTELILAKSNCMKDLGELYGGHVTEAELDFVIQEEWCTGLEDFIKRRTKLYLRLSDTEKKQLETAFKKKGR